MKKCKVCGGACNSTGGGQYVCDCCGQTYSESDFVVAEKSMAGRAPAKNELSGADIFERCSSGVLEIEGSGKDGAWNGSGYIITSDGYAITNAHVATNNDGSRCDRLVCTVCKQSVPARIVALGRERPGTGIDIALIKLERMPAGATKLKVVDSLSVRTGDQVFVIGNSLGYGTSITSGIIGDKDRDGSLMYDSATNPGNSGGPVLNADGNVIGTHYSGQIDHNSGNKAQGMNYAVPSHTVIEFVRKHGVYLG